MSLVEKVKIDSTVFQNYGAVYRYVQAIVDTPIVSKIRIKNQIIRIAEDKIVSVNKASKCNSSRESAPKACSGGRVGE